MRKALLVLGICILATPAWAGGGYSLFGSYGSVDNHEFAVGAGMRLTLGGDELGVRFLMNPTGNIIPYLGGGLTFFYVNLNDGNASNTVGGYAMFGINFGSNRTKFFVEALYRYGQSDVSYRNGGAEPWTGTMDVGGFAANAGIAWTF